MKKGLEVFFSLEGRISRGLWWVALLIYTIPVVWVLLLIEQSYPGIYRAGQFLIGIPVIFVNGKRFHDRNKSAWWVLVGVIPLIGPLWIFLECGCLAGTPDPNRFGFPNVFGSESKLMKKGANHSFHSIAGSARSE